MDAASAPAAPTASVATSDELRRAALQRSALRNAEVARRRVRWRWVGWLSRWAVLTLLLAVGATMLAWQWSPAARKALEPTVAQLDSLWGWVARPHSPSTMPPRAQSPSAAEPGASLPSGDH